MLGPMGHRSILSCRTSGVICSMLEKGLSRGWGPSEGYCHCFSWVNRPNPGSWGMTVTALQSRPRGGCLRRSLEWAGAGVSPAGSGWLGLQDQRQALCSGFLLQAIQVWL